MRWLPITLALMLSFATLPAACEPPASSARAAIITARDRAIPHFDHVFVIMDENKDAWRVDGGASAPTLSWLARTFGNATRFYGEVHPSEANYAALVGGTTLGIHDDDAYYCTPGIHDEYCEHADEPDYVAHVSPSPHIGDQLNAVGLTWKGYYESIPSDGSLTAVGSRPGVDGKDAPNFYGSKHSGFLNFSSAVHDPKRNEHLVGLQALQHDLDTNTAPNFALIVPNLCNDMHGMSAGPGVPESCTFDHLSDLIGRGDTMVKSLYTSITHSALWHAKGNSAIVITFDEDDGSGRQGCCGVTPEASSNFGGGHIATIVITNHHHRHIVDNTPYNHYSLLRTIEDAFGIHTYLGLANASEKGVKPMYPLFALQ